MLVLIWFERSLYSAQVSRQSCPWPLKLMTSQVVEWMWICTGGYGRLGANGLSWNSMTDTQRTVRPEENFFFLPLVIKIKLACWPFGTAKHPTHLSFNSGSDVSKTHHIITNIFRFCWLLPFIFNFVKL